MRTGQFLANGSDVISLDDLGHLRVYADTPFPYQVDGDDVDDTKELDITHVPDALAVVLPRSEP